MTAAETGQKDRLYDLGTLVCGVLEAVSAEGDIEVEYGSYKNFMPFRAKLERRGDRFVTPILTFRYCRVRGKFAKLLFADSTKPLRELGRIEADEPMLGEISRVCNRTIHCCILPHECGNTTIHLQPQKSRDFVKSWKGKQDNFVLFDGARRDREVWVGDLFYEIRACMFGFRDCESVRNSFDVILCQMDAEGHVPGSSISMLTFPDYTAWFFIVLADYYMLSGDREYLAENAPRLRKVLRHMLNGLEGGLLKLSRGQTWAWTLARTGFITSSNCILYKALLSAKQIFEAAGKFDLSAELDKRAAEVKSRLNRETFDESAGADRDAVGADSYTLDANALAVLFGVCEEKNRARVLAVVRSKFWTEHGSLLCWPKEAPTAINHNHNNNVWPFVNCFEIEARLLCGHTEEAEELVRRVYGGMLARGADTVWEFFDGRTGDFVTERMEKVEDDRDNYDSECHGWSAGVASLYLKYAAGVSPRTPGYETCSIKPDFMRYDRISATLPTGFGSLGISLERNEERAELRVELPKGITAFWEGQGKLTGRIDVYPGEPLPSGVYRMSAEYLKKKEAKAI